MSGREPRETTMHIRPEMKHLLREKEVSVLALSREMLVSPAYIYDLLLGTRTSPQRRKEIALRMGVSIGELAEACGWRPDPEDGEGEFS